MNLITILKTNGTGLLQGLCRPAEFDSFQNLEEDEVDVNFSLGEKNLGKFKIKIESVGDDEGNYIHAYLTGEDIYMDISFGSLVSLAKFEAVLNKKPKKRNDY